eukprot:scaffold4306_cov114-Isochrysis_galbana.AAC.1
MMWWRLCVCVYELLGDELDMALNGTGVVRVRGVDVYVCDAAAASGLASWRARACDVGALLKGSTGARAESQQRIGDRR